MAEIKPETKPEIKLDPADSPSNRMADIDEFDEALDLYIPPGPEQGGAWLVKVSQDLWKVWNDMYQNHNGVEPMQVGKLRVYNQKEGETSQRVQVHLNKDIGPHKLLPQVYNLDMSATGYNNTVVFSEKDLPGHRAQQFGGARNYNGSKPNGLQAKSDRYGQKKPGTYRTAIPKQTALLPMIVNEAIAKPVEDDSAMDFFKRTYDAAMNAGKKTTFINSVKKVKPASASSDFKLGSLSSKVGARKKNPKEKAVRMPHAELLDKLQGCFKQYQYWSLRALRTKLNQPEAWLKEVLEEIAIPMRSGDFAGNYRLTDHSKGLLKIEGGEEALAPDLHISDQGTGDERGDQDDDDADEFEDVEIMKSED